MVELNKQSKEHSKITIGEFTTPPRISLISIATSGLDNSLMSVRLHASRCEVRLPTFGGFISSARMSYKF